MTNGQPFEADLRAAREAQGMTLDDIQQRTRIPVDVLTRFEKGQLMGDETYNEVYLRAFLKSYARAIGLPAGDVASAYDRHRQGRYRGELRPGYVPEPEPEPVVEKPAEPAAVPTPLPTPVAAPPRPTPPAPPVAPMSSTRAARPAVPGSGRAFDKNWGAILGLTALVVAVLGMALWWLVFREAPRPDSDTVSSSSTPGIDSVGVGAAASAGPRLQLPIRITVTATGDGLQSFRVSQDGTRAPFWIETGASQTFQADSSLVLWGEGGDAAQLADATVEFQGLRWTPPSGQPLTLSTATAQRVLDSLSAAR